MKTYREFLTEAEQDPRIPHPEDSVFQGTAQAQRYVTALQEIAKNPGSGSIKWDGMIALYFGRDTSGKFFINDKYMPETFHAYSPLDWQRYDTEIKRSRTARPDLYKKIAAIWPGLEAAVGNTPGVFKGDLMFVGPLEPVNGAYVFQPVTVRYAVDVNSELGKLIAGRRALIVAHQFQDAPFTGKSFGNDQVTVIPPSMGIKFTLRVPGSLVVQAQKTVSGAAAQAIDQFLSGLPKTVQESIKKYFNHRATGQTSLDITEWLKANVSAKQSANLLAPDGYMQSNAAGYQALAKAWQSIATLKEALIQQLESQIKGISQTINGRPGGEGFVFPTSVGMIKLVSKGNFGAAHFSGFAAQKK